MLQPVLNIPTRHKNVETKYKTIIIGILLFITLLAAYANHFKNGFHFDDSHAVVENIHIRSLGNIPTFFTDPKMFGADRPTGGFGRW